MPNQRDYQEFHQLCGIHPYRDAAPNGFIDYEARVRRGGKVFYFNFELAKKMNLIAFDHPHELNESLRRTLLQTFSIEIINEYDIAHNLKVPPKDKVPGKYMATRYLQLQHPNKRGATSGDGRSVWNGVVKAKDYLWDVSSSGTGATALSPAVALYGEFYKSGDPEVPYGNGRADLLDGFCSAVMSEVFHANKIRTERTLCIIGFKDGSSINVRAYGNLLRPAHFFHYLKQENYTGVKHLLDYHIDRQLDNGHWLLKNRTRYEMFLEQVAHDFAEAAARFESEYIFCWLDWDGDNILMDSAIIDYGSVRQLGLFHHEYRYDDEDRMSTSIREQKGKAKYIVQTFAQLIDFIKTKKKKPLHKFKQHPSLKFFEATFEKTKDDILLYKMGLGKPFIEALLNNPQKTKLIREFRNHYSYFERVKSRRGKYKVEDGVTWDAIFCIRNIMRELPKWYLKKEKRIDARTFVEILKSDLASRRDLAIHRKKKTRIREFQKAYLAIVGSAAACSGRSKTRILEAMAERSAIINRNDRVTGDSIITIAATIIRNRKLINTNELHEMLLEFIEEQIMRPGEFGRTPKPQAHLKSNISKKIFKSLIRAVNDSKTGI